MKASAWANSGSELPGCDADGWHIRSELSGCDANDWHIRSELSGCDANGWHMILTTLPPQIATVDLAKGFARLWKNWE